MTGRRRKALVLGGSFGAYLALSLVLWWHVWSSHPSAVTLCGCEDPSLSVWFLEWPAYAIAHGHNPFYSTALFHPAGINLLSNTGMLAIGVPLAPVTWLFGPVAAFNVASTLGPPLTALAMCWLLMRWVEWWPAAVVGGLAFGFSPFVFANLAVGHLDLVVLALVPLVAGALDELVVRQRRGPAGVGVALGLLIVLQFFVSTEVLVLVVGAAMVGLVLVVGYAAVLERPQLRARAPHALAGLGVAVGVSAVLLAYPVWVALAGPAHLSGLIWPASASGTGVVGSGPVVVADLLRLRHASAPALHFFAGYQGGALAEPEYLGIVLPVVILVGLAAWWRNLRLWFLVVLGLLAVAAGLGRQSLWTPWRALAHLPIIQNVVPVRFMVVVTWCASGALAIVVSSVHGRVARAVSGDQPKRSHLGAWVGTACALAVAVAALVPVVGAEAANVPLTTEAVSLPRWFTHDAVHLPPGHVVLTFPTPVTGGSAMTWQAVDDLGFSLATGAGPESIPRRAGQERAGLAVLVGGGSVFSVLAPPTVRNVSAVRRALGGWGVTDVVVPSPSELVPPAQRAASTAWALGLLTLAIGRAPSFAEGSWVWHGVGAPSIRRKISAPAFDRCTATKRLDPASPLSVPRCVLAASAPG
jgi:hypothetical protein